MLPAVPRSLALGQAVGSSLATPGLKGMSVVGVVGWVSVLLIFGCVLTLLVGMISGAGDLASRANEARGAHEAARRALMSFETNEENAAAVEWADAHEEQLPSGAGSAGLKAKVQECRRLRVKERETGDRAAILGAALPSSSAPTHRVDPLPGADAQWQHAQGKQATGYKRQWDGINDYYQLTCQAVAALDAGDMVAAREHLGSVQRLASTQAQLVLIGLHEGWECVQGLDTGDYLVDPDLLKKVQEFKKLQAASSSSLKQNGGKAKSQGKSGPKGKGSWQPYPPPMPHPPHAFFPPAGGHAYGMPVYAGAAHVPAPRPAYMGAPQIMAQGMHGMHQPGGLGVAVGQCKRCLQFGHYAKHCPVPARGAPSGPGPV